MSLNTFGLCVVTFKDWIQWICVAVIIGLALLKSVRGMVRFIRWSRRCRKGGDSSLPPCCGGKAGSHPSCCNGNAGKNGCSACQWASDACRNSRETPFPKPKKPQ